VERRDTHHLTNAKNGAMTDYRRNFLAGGSLFFTVNLAERHPRRDDQEVRLIRMPVHHHAAR